MMMRWLYPAAALAAIVFSATLFADGKPSASAGTSDVATVGVDLDPTGNTATSIGTIQTTGTFPLSSPFPVDIVVNSIPAPGLTGIGGGVVFDPGVVKITGKASAIGQVLHFSGGSPSPFEVFNGLPDTDGSFRFDSLDLSGSDETGPGRVLTVTLECIGSGSSPIALTDSLTGGGANIGLLNQLPQGLYTVGTEVEATVTCGSGGTAPPTASPTASATATAIATATATAPATATATATPTPTGTQPGGSTSTPTAPSPTASDGVTSTPVPTGPTATVTPTATPTPEPTEPGSPSVSPAPTATPGPVLGDIDCSGGVGVADVILALSLGASLGSGALCSDLGDVDCSGQNAVLDALHLLRYLAHAPSLVTGVCGEIGGAFSG